MLVQPLPIDIAGLVRDIRKYFGTFINVIKRGWNVLCKPKSPEFYKQRGNISLHPESFCALTTK